MATTPINVKGHSSGGGGGLWGKIIGGLAGAAAGVAAPFTGGASLAAVPALMGTGMSVGGLIGDVVDPIKVTQPGGPNPLDTAAKNDPGVQVGLLEAAKNDIKGDNRFSSEENSYYQQALTAAQQRLKERMV